KKALQCGSGARRRPGRALRLFFVFFRVISWIVCMRVLITAGNTQAPIDRVRCLTNIFTGRTGAAIAVRAHERGHHVTLLTSHPEAVLAVRPERYSTFDDLQTLLSHEVQAGGYDA